MLLEMCVGRARARIRVRTLSFSLPHLWCRAQRGKKRERITASQNGRHNAYQE